MFRKSDEVHITTEAARAGITNVGLHYVLAISLTLAIVALSAIWIYGAITGDQHRSDSAVSNDQAKSSAVR
jgi:hypothetical protein